MAAPYFASGRAKQAAQRFALEDWGAAYDDFAAHLAAAHDPPLSDRARAHARLLMAIADTRQNEWTRAGAGFLFAAKHLPLIADYIYYQAARALYFAHQADDVIRYARRVDGASIVGADAELLIGDVLRGRGDHAAIAAHYGDYLERRPSGIRRAEARYRLAEALEAMAMASGSRARGDSLQRAVGHYRIIAVRAPLSPWGQRSSERLQEIIPLLPAAEQSRAQTLSADELIERGMAYFQAMRNPLSEADFAQALSAPGISGATRCVAAYHRAQSVFKARNRERAAPLFDAAIADCKQAQNQDLHVKAAYQAGRSYAFIGEHEKAIVRYTEAETASDTHTYRDDARLRQAEEWTELGNDNMVEKVLASIPQKYPEGDMRAEALWRLGWRAYRERNYRQAIQWFDAQIAAVPIDTNFWAEGQAQYWKARSLGKLGRRAQSVAAYRDTVMTYPLSYYALLSLNRLRERHPKQFRALRREIRTPSDAKQPNRSQNRSRDAPDSETQALQFRPRAEYQTPAFARALEFLRLGLGRPAAQELRRLGMSAPSGRREVTDLDRQDKLWAAVYLYHLAGRYDLSHWPTRWHLLEYKRHWPAGDQRQYWELAYPRAFWDLIDSHSQTHGVPTELAMAIMREESAFDPLRESYANAIGLMQMIFPTAKRFAEGTGIAVSRTTLRDPEKNVTIGSRFLGFLWQKWQGMLPLIPPSYNAGENAVARWLRERGHLDADEFIESIAGDQARRYSKRVLSSFFTYTYLYSDEIPRVGNRIPRRVRNSVR